MRRRTASLALMVTVVALVATAQAADAWTCPVNIKSFSIAGKAASGKEYMYDALASADADVTAVDLTVTTSSGVADVPVSALDRSDLSDAPDVEIWFSLPAGEVATSAIVSGASTGSSFVKCSTSDEAPVAFTRSVDRTAVYDDAHPHADLDERGDIGPLQATDSDFHQRVTPDYPDLAKETGIVGNVCIEIEVGPKGGHPQAAWVRYDFESGASHVLVGPALEAANNSTFSPPMLNGLPTTRRYLIIYEFMLDGEKIASDIADKLCPLSIDELDVEGPSGGDPNAWYFLSITAKRDDIVSAVIGARDGSGSRGYVWSGFKLQPKGSKSWSATALFNWPRTDVEHAWIDSVATASGKTIQCYPVYEEPQEVIDSPAPPRVIVGKPLPLIAVQSPVAPAFVHEVWPIYPADASGKRAAGDVTVVSIVGEGGFPIDAFVTKSSGSNPLDIAAMAAAQASAYTPAAPGGIIVYEMTYRFVP